MNQRLADAAKAKFVRGDVPGDVAAIFDDETSPNDLDGRKFRFVVANANRSEYVEAEITGSNGGSPWRIFDSTLLEAAIERRISNGYYSSGHLMDELAMEAPISLREEDLRPHPPRSAFF